MTYYPNWVEDERRFRRRRVLKALYLVAAGLLLAWMLWLMVTEGFVDEKRRLEQQRIEAGR